MLLWYKHSVEGVVLVCKIRNSSVSTGAGLTGLTHSSSGLNISVKADNESTTTTYTSASSNVETITTIGTYQAPTSGKCRFKELDATNHKGIYEIHLANSRYSVSNATYLLVSISGPTNCAETDFIVRLSTMDPQTAVPSVASIQSGLATQVSVDTVDTIVDAIKLKTDNLPSDPADASVIAGRFDSVDTAITTLTNYVDTEVAAIKSKTDNLPTDPADASDIAAAFSTVNSTLTTLGSYIDTEVAAIKLKTDNLPASPASTGDCQTGATAALNAYDPPTMTELTAAFTEIKGTSWSSTLDTLNKISDIVSAGGGSGGLTEADLDSIVARVRGVVARGDVPAASTRGFDRPFYAGDVYTGNRKASITITGWSGQDIADADSITLTAVDVSDADNTFTWTATVGQATQTGSTVVIYFDLDATDTDQTVGTYNCDCRVVWGTEVVTVLDPDAKLIIKAALTP
jgi:hypothetical protein